MTLDFPEYPSATVTVEASRYMEAVAALNGIPLVFCDGESILLPESEADAIAMLRERFEASVVWGQSTEYEFATKARKAGVPIKLLRLGQSVQGCTGQDVDEMVSAALEAPGETLQTWCNLYRSSMNPH